MDGITFYQALEAGHPRELAHLAFVTGGAFGDRATQFLAEHEVVVVAKPLEKDQLLVVIDRLATAAA